MSNGFGHCGTGEEFSALERYMRLYTSGTCPAQRVVQSICSTCGGTTFTLEVDDEEGCARRQCSTCSDAVLIADSAEYWHDADPGEAACPCGAGRFEIGVAFSVREDLSVRWITVGGRCVTCGSLGVYTDWKIDYDPTDHLPDAL